jgi:hypothetical protein
MDNELKKPLLATADKFADRARLEMEIMENLLETGVWN